MANNYQIPGVYIEEKNAFPNSVVGVATAVPAFVGYTEKAMNQDKDLTNQPFRISSLAEYHQYFGSAPHATFTLQAAPNTSKGYQLQFKSGRFFLYYSIQHFFVNGGTNCYIVSVGDYQKQNVKVADFYDNDDTHPKGIPTLLKEYEPTLLVVPDAMLFNQEGCAMIHRKMLEHCEQMASRFAILDVYLDMSNGKDEQTPDTLAVVGAYRDSIGNQALKWGAAYYPWLHTTIIQESDLHYTHIDSASFPTLIELLENELQKLKVENYWTKVQVNGIEDVICNIGIVQTEEEISNTHKILITVSPLYQSIIKSIQEKLNLLPPSGAVAGIYTMTDHTRGVFKAPANVNLNSVIQPFVNINNTTQEFLNIPPDGKAVNAIRAFPGKGVLVWGSRTLAGNDNEWRYVSVRRTFIYLEQSIQLALKAYIFEPNTATTWIMIEAMISNFLTGFWQQGGLMGANPKDAFYVAIGLGKTMTAEDILDGVLRVTVGVAAVRPAEFIIFTLQQKMQRTN